MTAGFWKSWLPLSIQPSAHSLASELPERSFLDCALEQSLSLGWSLRTRAKVAPLTAPPIQANRARQASDFLAIAAPFRRGGAEGAFFLARGVADDEVTG